MKRLDLIRYLIKEGCVFIREGKNHSLFSNPIAKRFSTIPRHKEKILSEIFKESA